MSDNYIGRGLPATVTPPAAAADAGRVLQSLAHIRGDYQSNAVTIPFDDTIPQITEGVEFFTVTIAPQRVGSRIRCTAQFCGSLGAAAVGIIALFRSDSVNAIAASVHAPTGADYEFTLPLCHDFVTTALTPLTLSIRGGTGGGNAIKLNGRTGRTLGGIENSFLRVEEIAV